MTTRLAGVIGWPVSHSRSPRLHGHWLRHYGIDGAYVPLPIRPEDFAEAVRLLPRMGFVGANVTVPHKEAAFRLATRLDPVAERAHAEPGAGRALPDASRTFGDHGAADQAMAAPGETSQLYRCLVERSRLIEPAPVAIQHLIGTDDQGARMTRRDSQRLGFGKRHCRRFDTVTRRLHAILDRRLVDISRIKCCSDTGATQHLGARGARGSKNQHRCGGRHQAHSSIPLWRA